MMGRVAQQVGSKASNVARRISKVHNWQGHHKKSYMTGQWDTPEYMMYITRILHVRNNVIVNLSMLTQIT